MHSFGTADPLASEHHPAVTNHWHLGFRDGKTKIDYSFQEIFADEIAEHFKQLMLAAGFSELTIADAFDKLAQEVFEHRHAKPSSSSGEMS